MWDWSPTRSRRRICPRSRPRRLACDLGTRRKAPRRSSASLYISSLPCFRERGGPYTKPSAQNRPYEQVGGRRLADIELQTQQVEGGRQAPKPKTGHECQQADVQERCPFLPLRQAKRVIDVVGWMWDEYDISCSEMRVILALSCCIVNEGDFALRVSELVESPELHGRRCGWLVCQEGNVLTVREDFRLVTGALLFRGGSYTLYLLRHLRTACAGPSRPPYDLQALVSWRVSGDFWGKFRAGSNWVSTTIRIDRFEWRTVREKQLKMLLSNKAGHLVKKGNRRELPTVEKSICANTKRRTGRHSISPNRRTLGFG